MILPMIGLKRTTKSRSDKTSLPKEKTLFRVKQCRGETNIYRNNLAPISICVHYRNQCILMPPNANLFLSLQEMKTK
ncbi:hypothetical protein JCM6294_617 [Bacteroides pyogenes DSM 20611 = JCM 6294]|uniref:Uncharacterized protein n=1 Tax=Bacteroides pyogenes DSM 20611 = JCM 6294 TaxID=1121100 RepID=W4PDH0_9BACE|nr:hypothetical protein JCM6294_617 [Bacteroides pyogenes DSM 20611 = JCM 6294]